MQTNAEADQQTHGMLQKLEKQKSDHLIATILMLEKIKKSNLAKIGKEKEFINLAKKKKKKIRVTEKIIEELLKIIVK